MDTQTLTCTKTEDGKILCQFPTHQKLEEYQKPEDKSQEVATILGLMFVGVVLLIILGISICCGFKSYWKKYRNRRMNIEKEQDEKSNELVTESKVTFQNEVDQNKPKDPAVQEDESLRDKQTQNESELVGIKTKLDNFQAIIQQLTESEEMNKKTNTELGELKTEIEKISVRITKLETKKPGKNEIESKVSRLVGELSMVKDSIEYFYCRYCEASFPTTYGLKTHLKSKHNKLPTDNVM